MAKQELADRIDDSDNKTNTSDESVYSKDDSNNSPNRNSDSDISNSSETDNESQHPSIQMNAEFTFTLFLKYYNRYDERKYLLETLSSAFEKPERSILNELVLKWTSNGVFDNNVTKSFSSIDIDSLEKDVEEL
ncbi:hypothetical protein FQA39_LY02210 [Lamprigera yunnana]|nr:hypothetical protein FQA39_LY02210 [Lamprigera yunnana]